MIRHGIRTFLRPNRSARKPINGATTTPGIEPAAINRPARFSDSPKVLRISGVELTKIELCKRPTAVTENTRTFDGSDIAPRLEFTCLLYLVHQIWKQNRFLEGI